MSDADPFASSAGLPSISFATKDQYGNLGSKPVGTRIGGKVLKAPSLVQSRDFDKGTPEAWPDGNPKMSVVIDINVDGEDMSLWVKKPSQLFKEFGEAIARASGVPVGPGAMIFVTLTGFAPPEAGKMPAKIYSVEYTPGSAFAADSYTPAPSVPTTPEGYTLDSLAEAGWTIEQVRASYPHLVPVPAAPPAPPTPPAAPMPPPPPAPPAAPTPPAAPSPSEREAKIAAMSSADRALLGL